MTILLQEKLPNVRLTFHMRQHGKLSSVCCGCDATVSLTVLGTVMGKQKKKKFNGLCHLSKSGKC